MPVAEPGLKAASGTSLRQEVLQKVVPRATARCDLEAFPAGPKCNKELILLKALADFAGAVGQKRGLWCHAAHGSGSRHGTKLCKEWERFSANQRESKYLDATPAFNLT